MNFKAGFFLMSLTSLALAGEVLFTTPTIRETEWFLNRHAAKLQEIKDKKDARIVFYGDSITEQWEIEGYGKKIWEAHFQKGPMQAINFGYGGDSTHHLLWRLENGEADNLNPPVVVVQIGTNNAWNQPEFPPCDTVLGVKAVLKKLREKFPISRIILCAIPPCGEKPDDPRRIKNDCVNTEIKKFANFHTIFWLDWAKPFLNEEGILDRTKMPDFVHPSPEGFQVWYEALEPMLKEFLYLNGTPETLVPQTKNEQEWWISRMRERRAQILAKEDKKFDLVFLGDSISHFWEESGKEAAKKHLGKFSLLNYGFGGDWVQNTLWHVKFGALDNYEAKFISLLIGTNNTMNPADDVVAGIKEILAVIRQKQPNAKIILTALFPRYDRPENNNAKINSKIKEFANGKEILWLDLTDQLNEKHFLDKLHPNSEGYEIWSTALEKIISQEK